MSPVFAHRTLMRIAFSAAHAFAWVMAFQFFLERTLSLTVALSSVALTYALTHVIVIILTPITAAHLRVGVQRSLLLAVCAAAAAFAAFAAGIVSDMALGITAFALLLGLYRALYFVPYSLMPTTLSRTGELAVALMPAAAGILIAATSSPMYLYAFASICIALSTISSTRSLS